ncbi:MAG: asparagine synthase-related protein [bacterium]
MPNLCGAWAVSGGPIERCLSESDKNAMLAQLPGGSHGLDQFSAGPLWLAAGAGNMAHDGGSCLAVEGDIAFEEDGPQNLEKLLKQQKSRPSFDVFLSGHYSLVCADTARNVLILLRDYTGGGLLFYIRSKDLLLFSVSTRPLLAHSRVPRMLDPEAATEFMLNGFLSFGTKTLFSGIQLIPPGHILEASRDGIQQRRHWKQLLKPPDTNPLDTPRRLRQSLIHAVKLAIGSDSEAAVSLSGGKDSSVIAACAVELLGPKNVHAFTYEFQDPSHPSEAPYARQFCRHLRIQHHTVKITYRDYLDAIPETLWRMEVFSHVVQAARIPFIARAARKAGFAKILDGHGTEAVLGLVRHYEYLDKVAQVLPLVRWPGLTLRYWKLAVSPQNPWSELARILAGKICPDLTHLTPPPPVLYHLILCVLQHNKIIGDISVFYPPSLRELVRRAVISPHVCETVQEIKDLPLSVQLQYLNYGCLALQSQYPRLMPLARATGASLVAPAAFLHPACLPAQFWQSWRPGRKLLQEAMKNHVPEAVFNRPTDLLLTCNSESWVSEIMRFLAPVVSQSRDYLKVRYFEKFDIARKGFSENLRSLGPPYTPFGLTNMNLLALWHRCHVELPLRTIPPDWAILKSGK